VNAVKKTIFLFVLWSSLAVVTTGLGLALAAARELTLSEPQTIAMILGTYEGKWIDHRSNRNGSLFVNFSVNPHDGDKPFWREAKVVGASTIDPNRASLLGGKIDQNKLVFSHASGWSKYKFYEENGQIKARGEFRYETGPMAGSGGTHELLKVEEVSQTPKQQKD
jgi:hypothetical protein